MRDVRLLAGGIGVGTLLMYFLDPRTGRRRRALLVDKLLHFERMMRDSPRVVGKDFAHRACGLWAETKRWLNHEAASDQEIAARVRAKLGRFVSHPHAIDSVVREGRAIMSGAILAHEVEPLLREIRHVQGVLDVENRLIAHEHAGRVPALQGGVPRRGERFELLQDRWSPAARVLAGTVGAGLIANGVRAGGPLGLVAALAGGALVLRVATNRDALSLLGIGEETRGFDAHKTVHVAAPPERVFRFWADFTNFPRFMSRVRDVRLLEDGRSRWTVVGPAGVPVQWTAAVTKMVENALIEWRTDSGSAVRHHGCVRFAPNSNGGTRVQIQLHYLPPAGVLGHAVASFFSVDPKSDMDEDLMRMKSTIETGHAPHDAAQPASRETYRLLRTKEEFGPSQHS